MRRLIIAFFAALALLPIATHAQTTTSTIEFVAPPVAPPRLQIPIPEVHFSGLVESEQVTDSEGNTYRVYKLPFLGEFVAGLVKYGIPFGALIAIFMMVLAGFEWAVSGAGNVGKIEHAKGRMVNAVLGLIILSGISTILYIVNPELVIFRGIRVQVIEPLELSPEEIEESEERTAAGEPSIDVQKGLPTDEPSVSKLAASNQAFCTPSKTSSQISYPGLTINYSELGRLDCNQSKSGRAAIAKIVLHEGLSAGKNKVQQTVTMWRKNYIGYNDTCKIVKGGKFNHDGCSQEGAQIFVQKPASSHYAVDTDGTIYQLSDENMVQPHCAGTPGQTSCNKDSVGIDLIYGPGPSYTEAQYASLAKLIAAITKKYGLAINDAVVHAHADCQANRKDPRNLDWDKLGKLAGGTLSPAAHPKTVAPYTAAPYSCN